MPVLRAVPRRVRRVLAPRARPLVAPHRGCAQRSRALAPTLSTHSARDEKTYRAAQRTYFTVCWVPRVLRLPAARELRLRVQCAVCSFDIPLLTGRLRRTACALYACKPIRGLYQYLGLPHCLSRCCRRTAQDGWYSVALIHKALRYHIGTAGRVRDRSRKLARLRIRARGCDHRLRGRGRRRRAFSERHLRVKRGTSGLVSLDWFGAHLLRWGPAFITCGATKPRHSGGHLSCLPWPNAMCMAAPNA